MKMKNLVFALAALSLAATARGATVEWTSGDLDVSSLAPISSVTAYYYVVTGSSASELANLLNGGDWGTSDLLDTTDDGWSIKSDFSNNSLLNAGGTTSSTSPFATTYTQTGVTEDEYVIAVYEATTQFGGKYTIASIGYFDYDAENTLDPDNPGYGVNSITEGIGSDAIAYNNDNGWAAVPEPTTVALLALGLAAVGLKRKVA